LALCGVNHRITVSSFCDECELCLLQEDTGGPGGGVASSNFRGFAHKRKVKASQLSVRQGTCSLTKSQQNFHLRNICTYKREEGTCKFAEQQNNKGFFKLG
jgi:hypothetical protein